MRGAARARGGGRRRLWWLLPFATMTAAAFLPAIHARWTRQSDVEAFARLVPEPMARHLVFDDDEALRRYAATAGHDATAYAYHRLFRAPLSRPAGEFEAVEAQNAHACRRLAAVLDSEFGLGGQSLRYETYARRPLPQRRHILDWTQRLDGVAHGGGMTLEQRADECLQLIADAERIDARLAVAEAYAMLCEFLPRLQRMGELRRYLEAGIAVAEREGDYPIACQMLGQLGAWHGRQGDVDSMRVCWDRALAHARRTKNWQEARILEFYAGYYETRGQLALARDYMLQARARCRELQAHTQEIRFLVGTLRFFADLECWSVVDRELRSADALLRRGSSVWHPQTMAAWTARVQLVKAERAAAGGDCSEIGEHVHRVLRDVDPLPPSPWREQARLVAAKALLRCDEPAAAESLVASVREICAQFSIPELLPVVDMHAAELLAERGALAAAESTLARVRAWVASERDGLSDMWSAHDVVWVGCALRAGDRRLAFERFGRGLERAGMRQRSLGTSPEAYLAWTEARSFHALGHEILRGDAVASYGFELAWRRLRAHGEQAWRPATADVAALRAQLEGEAMTLARALDDHQSMHCMYETAGDIVVRWICFQGRVACDTLTVPSGEIERLAASVHDRVWVRPANDREAVAAGAALARIVLPARAFADPPPRRLLISTDDAPLDGVPFAALSTSAMSFAPLIDRFEIAYLRFHADPRPANEGAPLIVYDPGVPASLRRRFSFLQEALPSATREAEHARAVFPGATVLTGAAATKAAVLASASRAPVIYVATHIVHDPEVPYLSFIPLAASDASEQEAYLELGDVRGADLRGCRLAILSGCGSGQSFATTAATCPSLGQALVDAGARAAIHTYTDVKDDEAHALMTDVLESLRLAWDPIRALSEAQRAAIRAGQPPRAWATYAITVSTANGDGAAVVGAGR